jgi:hypothetical protein
MPEMIVNAMVFAYSLAFRFVRLPIAIVVLSTCNKKMGGPGWWVVFSLQHEKTGLAKQP